MCVCDSSPCHSPCPVWGNTLTGVIKKLSCLCPWAEIGDYSGLRCQIYGGARTRRRLNLRPLSCWMSLSRTFVFTQVPGWSLNQILLTCSQDACRSRDGVCSVPGVMLCLPRMCLGISAGRKCIHSFSQAMFTTSLTSSVVIGQRALI